MVKLTKFKHKKRMSLFYDGECYIHGVEHNSAIIVEEYYDDGYIAQHKFAIDGELIETRDEQFGQRAITPFQISETMIQPHHTQEHLLDFTGIRFKGLRETDRVAEWVQPLPIMGKMPLLQQLEWDIAPMMLMGIAESKVLTQTILSPEEILLCRRLRLLVALPEKQTDDTGLVYDYETRRLHVLQAYNPQTQTTQALHEALHSYPELSQPSDCLYIDNLLIVADNSHENPPSTIHLYQMA